LGVKYTRETPELIVIGSASRDLAPDDRRGWRLGGGVSYGSLTAARLGVRTAAIIGVDAPASRAVELDLLRQAGVSLELVELERAPVFDNVETPTGRVQDCLEPGQPLPADRVPAEWRDGPAWLLAPVAGELEDEWAAIPPPTAVIALGWQGLLRDLEAGRQVRRKQPRASPLLDRADIVGVGAEDLDVDVDLADLLRLLPPAATLLLTRGERGGLVTTSDPGGPVTRRFYPAVPARRVLDPTGAGDVLLAALVATRLDPRLADLRRNGADLRFAASAASLVVEQHGLAGVPDLRAVVERMRSSVESGG
jgi:sugar/nucleoside kinase (ribokinase family)